ncbi:LamG domain-containing protein [Nocardiopsis akebiae]|uniref:LamG domain-containing protein n=1 Tax=Nocardiopsis akebiae TaxID=2831968 RepID=A0ABX8C599_9ACTN|nr:LamG domain-containing protein [Nocardiopsis akebiae]QUX29574.1 LamG domain-containing protein [Nocardiopsis akebiae]
MRRSLTRATAVTTAAALALSLLTSSTALAEENDPVLTEEARAEQAALEQAAETGESVPVEELLGERRDVVANPDGTFTATEYVQPVRTRQDDMWVDTDPTLVEREDGRLAPRASTLGLSLSNGGEGPLAVLTRAGKELELGWPTSLPEPTVDGETATYPQVLPGVDLVLRASVDGLSQVLVVEDAEAAAQPEIAQLRMSVSVDGLQMATTDHGGIEAVDTSVGGAVFEAPTPLMWDSGSSGDDELSTMSADAADTELDPVEGPLESSTIAQIGVEASDDTLVLTPNEQLLQDSATNYPVYIDPIWKTSTTSAWAMVSSGYRADSYWKFSGSDDEGVGRCPQLAGDPYYCNSVGIKRLFYRISTSAYADKQILSAEFAVTLRHTYDSTGRATRLYRTGGITSSTTWANQPSWTESLDTKSPTTPAGSCTRTNQNVRFDAKSAVEWAASGRRSTTTFGLRSVNEDSYSHWKRFCDNAQLEVNYNTVPNQPRQTDLQLEPGGACVYGNQRPYVDEPPRVSAYLRDPDHSTGATEQVRAQFRVFWTDEAGQEQERTFTTSYKAANSRFYYQVPDDIPEGAVLGWVVRAHDGHAWSPWSWDGEQTRCEFVYDSTVPEEPTITSTRYPNDDQWHTGVGDTGTFRLQTTSEDVEFFRWGVNEHPSAGNEVPASTSLLNPDGPSYYADLSWVPEREGPHSLYVEAVDAAGNVSSRASHLFLVSSGRPEISRWVMDGADSSGLIEDVSGNRDAQAGSSVSFIGEGPSGASSGSVLLAGDDQSYIDPPASTNSSFERMHSFSGWVRLDDVSSDQVLVSRFGDEKDEDGNILPREFRLYYSAENQEWVLEYSYVNREICRRCPDPWHLVEKSISVSGGSAGPGQWAHVAYVANLDSLNRFSPVAGFHGARLYVNGEVVDEVEVSRNSISPIPAITGDVRFGRQFNRTDSGRAYTSHLKGALHDVRLFDRLLAPSEVENLVELPTARDAYWNFTDVVDGASPEASGEQSMALHDGAGIFTGDPFLEPALVGEGHLELGSGGYANTGEAVVATNGSFTLSLRARLASAQPEQSMSVLSQAGQTQSPFDVRYSAEADRWELLLAHEDTSGSATTNVINDLFVPSSEQSGDHLAVVYDAFSREVRFYVNGQLSQTSTVQHSSPWVSTGPLSIGRALHDGAWGSSFSGAVDDVRVYRGAADATLISRLASLTEQPDL